MQPSVTRYNVPRCLLSQSPTSLRTPAVPLPPASILSAPTSLQTPQPEWSFKNRNQMLSLPSSAPQMVRNQIQTPPMACTIGPCLPLQSHHRPPQPSFCPLSLHQALSRGPLWTVSSAMEALSPLPPPCMAGCFISLKSQSQSILYQQVPCHILLSSWHLSPPEIIYLFRDL